MGCYESQTLTVVFGEQSVTLASSPVPTLLLEIDYPVLLVAEFRLIFQDEV